jgi:competence protein ComEA
VWPRPWARAGPRRRACPLDLNTATVEQLDALDGIGPATAQQIVDYREAHGGFGSVEELDQVPGIGETRLAALREKVRV